MTKERREMFMAGMHALEVAIECDDPKREIAVRIKDLIAEAKALSPPEPTEGVVDFLRTVHVALNARFPRCRDCADDGPVCPNSGLPCDLKSEFDAIYAALRAMPLQQRVTHPGADGPDPNMPAAGWSKP